MCRLDPIFWVDLFGWTFNPRGKVRKMPWQCFSFQQRGFREIKRCIDDQEDCIILKSRDMGVSWLTLFVMGWYWLFEPLSSFLLMSRDSKLVDKAGDPKSLFWKIDFIIKHLPPWMVPPYKRTEMHLENQANDSTIDGASSTGDAPVGDRRTAAFMDEFSKMLNAQSIWGQSADMADCRIINGTPKGTGGIGGQFYECSKIIPEKNRLRFHWSEHPLKNEGLYYDETGKPLSPWYLKRCERAGWNKAEIAQELDIDFLGSGHQFFDAEAVGRHRQAYLREPLVIGDLSEHGFHETPGGPLRLWRRPDGKKFPPGDYVVGCDVSQGQGASNSTASVTNRSTGEMVAELVTNRMRPDEFADVVVMLCWWLHEAFLIWEANGPGLTFGDRVLSHGYRNVYWRKNLFSLSQKETDTPGWWATPGNKSHAFRHYAAQLYRGAYLCRSAECLDEHALIIWNPMGRIEHQHATGDDPTGARSNHADRVMAAVLSVFGCGDLEVQRQEAERPKIIPANSLGGRYEAYLRARAEVELW